MIITYPFSDSPSNYTLTNTELIGGKAQLTLTNNTGQVFNQPFTSSSGFTFDAAKAEFSGGKVQQKDQRPANATFGATYTTDINGSWGSGSLTGTGTGSPTVSAGKLVLTGGGLKFVSYPAANITSLVQTGTIRLKYTPNYSTTPAANRFFFGIAESAVSVNNKFNFYHDSTGHLRIYMYSSTGALLIGTDLGFWNPTSGTEYEFCICYDLTSGSTKTFIDGIQFGSTISSTGTRSNSIGTFNIGTGATGTDLSDFYINDLICYSTVLFTSNYTPGYTVVESSYCASNVDLPIFTYSDIGTIQALTGFTTTEANTPRYTINSKYWNGSAWVASSGVYAQANTKTDINAHISTLTIGSTYSVSILFTDSNTQSNVDGLNITYTGQKYNLSGSVKTSGFTCESISLIVETVTKPASTTLTYAIEVDGILKWWDGAAWSTSNGAVAQTNSIATIITNLTTLITVVSTVKMYMLLETSVPTVSTPDIDELSVTYDYAAVITSPTTCIVYGIYRDISGIGVNGATVTATLYRSSGEYKEASASIIESPLSVTTGPQVLHPAWADGYFELDLIWASEYEGTGLYKITIEKASSSLYTAKTSTGAILITVPDSVTKNITDLVTAV